MMNQPPVMPAQQISLLDIYTKQIEMGAQMRSMVEKLPDHENRIRSLEEWRYGMPIAALIAMGSLAATIYELSHR